MIDAWESLENNLVDLVEALYPDLTVILSFENGREPPTPYAVINVDALDAVGREVTETLSHQTSGQEMLTTQEVYEASVAFTFIGKTTSESANLAADFSHKLATPAVYDLLDSYSLSLMEKGPVRRVPLRRETDWYNSYVQEAKLTFAIQTENAAQVVEHVSIDGQIDNFDLNITLP